MQYGSSVDSHEDRKKWPCGSSHKIGCVGATLTLEKHLGLSLCPARTQGRFPHPPKQRRGFLFCCCCCGDEKHRRLRWSELLVTSLCSVNLFKSDSLLSPLTYL